MDEAKTNRLKEQIALIEKKLALYEKVESTYTQILELKKKHYKMSGDKPEYMLMDEFSRLQMEYEVNGYELEKLNKQHLIEQEKMILDTLKKKLEEGDKEDDGTSE
jgi:uncharacterized protein YqfB (UPF0267 family)